MSVRRLELPGGQWVDVVDQLTHAQGRRVRAAQGSGRDDRVDEGVAAIVVAWSIVDVDGRPIECPTPAAAGIPTAAMDRIPDATFVELAAAAVDHLATILGGPDPNRSGGGSSGGSRQDPPASPSPTPS